MPKGVNNKMYDSPYLRNINSLKSFHMACTLPFSLNM